MQIFVQFSDSAKTKIISVFSCVQDESIWPNQGTIESNDARYAAYISGLQNTFGLPMVTTGN